MAFSIRTKLTFWYVTLLTISLLAFGAIFSYTLTNIFIERVDEQIGSVSNMMVHTVIRPSGELLVPGDFDIILERFFGVRIAGNYIQVLDPGGKVMAKSSNLERSSLPLSGEALNNGLAGNSTFEVFRKFGKYPVRVVTKPIMVKDKGLVAFIQVGASLEGMEEIFHELFFIFISGLGASVAIAGAMGWFLARKALKPVAMLTAMARNIGVHNLNERIQVEVKGDEIGRLAATMNEMIARLERSFNQVRQFTADASHELKTPLTILKGEMEIALRSGGGVEAMRDALKSSLEEIDRMSYIVRNLLDLAKMDVEKEAAPFVRVQVDGILTERFDHFKRFALDKGIRLAILRNDPVEVMGDPVRIGQLIFNLMDNALKYTDRGGSVEVCVERNGGFAIIMVKDTGIGIAKEDQPYIFDRFYRVDKARSRDTAGQGGTLSPASAGLGLSICKEIADGHKGLLEVESEYGKGSVFTVRLPMRQY